MLLEGKVVVAQGDDQPLLLINPCGRSSRVQKVFSDH